MAYQSGHNYAYEEEPSGPIDGGPPSVRPLYCSQFGPSAKIIVELRSVYELVAESSSDRTW